MPEGPAIDTGNTVWLLVSTALVLLMTPGLALFYGGLNRSKGVLNMMMMSFSCHRAHLHSLVVLRLLLAFGANGSAGVNNVIGNFADYLGTKTFLGEGDLWGATAENVSGIGVPIYVFMAFQMMFAIITVALISGAISDRTKFAGWLLFAFGLGRPSSTSRSRTGCGAAASSAPRSTRSTSPAVPRCTSTPVRRHSAWCLVLGKRIGWPRESFKPHNVPFVALGAGLLWFGWFGFNAGSELTVDSVAGSRLHQHPGRHRRRAARLDHRRVDPGRQADPGRRLLRCRRRSGRHHPGLRLRRPLGGRPARPRRRCGLRPGGQPEVQARLRRLARRGRRALRRWLDRLALARPVRHQPVNAAITDVVGATDGLFYGGGVTQLGRQAARRPDRHRLLVRCRAPPRLADRQDHRLPGHAGGRGRRHRRRRARRERVRHCHASTGGSGGAFAMAGISPGQAPAAEPAAPVSEKVAG